MAKRSNIKITVLKRFNPSDVFKKPPATHVEPFGVCSVFKDGQEFIVGQDGKMPESFCTSAWVSIYPNVNFLRFGGDLPYFKEKGVAVNCCIDGLRPVVFKIERV